MPVLLMNCPQEGCGAQHASFRPQKQYLTQSADSSYCAWLLLSCPACNQCVLCKVISSSALDYCASNAGEITKMPRVQVVTTYPKSVSPDTPEHVPEDIGRMFSRACAAIARNEAETAGMLLRKALDGALTRKFPHCGDGMLGQKLQRLKPNEDLPVEMVEWAKEIKNYGNAAAHELEEPPIAEVIGLRDFTELFLEYTYTLPEELKRRRQVAQ